MISVREVSYMHFVATVDDELREHFSSLATKREQTNHKLMQSVIERGWIELLGEQRESEVDDGLDRQNEGLGRGESSVPL